MLRTTQYKISSELQNRWSPRSFIPEEITDEKLMTIFEAARFAPSAYNSQPWRFIYAKRDTPEWDVLFSSLVEFNQSWVKNASALVVVVSKKNFEHNNKPSVTHQLDTGSAWMSMALEAQHQGYYAHGMSGFDFEKAATDLKISGDFDVLAMVAIGKKDSIEKLPPELQKMKGQFERKPLTDIIFKGSM